MLLKMEQLFLMVGNGTDGFKARPDLTDEQKAELLRLDTNLFNLCGEHLITNFEELKK